MSALTWKQIEKKLLAVADAIEQTDGVPKRAASCWRRASRDMCANSGHTVYSVLFKNGQSRIVQFDESAYGLLQGLLNALPPSLSDPGNIAHAAFSLMYKRILADAMALQSANLVFKTEDVSITAPALSVWIGCESRSGKAFKKGQNPAADLVYGRALSKVADVIEKETGGLWKKES